MSIKVFQTNKTGKIEFTRCELEKLLNETYREGYTDGENHAKSNYWTWTSPSLVNGAIFTCDNSSAIRSNTVDDIPSISRTATFADEVTGSNDAANVIKVDVCASVDKNSEATAKVDMNETPTRTYEIKGMTYNMEDLAKTVEALLNDKSIFDMGLYAYPSLNGAKKAVKDTPFTNLEKELRSL